MKQLSKNQVQEFKATINYGLTRYGWTKEEMAAKLQISPATFYNRLNDPRTFKCGEVLQLAETLHLNTNDIFTMMQ